ncbi:MAG: hypothetical protein ACON4R_02830 [Akkermansiaceae bacterium]
MTKKRSPLFSSANCLAAVLLCGLSSASAQLTGQYGILDLTANDGINPNTGQPWQEGDQYRLAFYTASTITAESDDPATYDDFATAQANQSTLGNGNIQSSTGWTAMVWVNTDDTRPQALDFNNIQASESPISSPRARAGTEDTTGGSGIGGAGVPVFAMDGTTCIARNNGDIYNNWSNPFNGDTTLRLASGSTNENSDGEDVVASQNVNYSPFLDQFGLGDSATVHGENVWTGGLSRAVNPLGNSVDANDAQQRTRASWGSSNANNGGRTWNRFQSNTTASLAVYALSEVLTIGTGTPVAPLVLTISQVADPGTGFDLSWPSRDGRLYRIRSSATLDSAPITWNVVQEDIPSDGETTSLTLTPGETKLFYVVEEYTAP